MKVLITGGAGFIGSHLADVLVSRRQDVTVIDNLSSGRMENIRHLLNRKRFRFIRADLLCRRKLESIFEKGRYDAVFHLAANSDIGGGVFNPETDFNHTFLTAWNTLECCRLFGVGKFLFASSSAVYGENAGKLREETGPFHPISYYGAAKLAAESFVHAYAFLNDIQTWIVRFPNVVGERATHGVIYDFIRKLKKNPLQLEILGNGRQKKPYVYVKDLVEAVFLVFQNASERVNVYNVGVDDRLSVNEIAGIVCREMRLEGVKIFYTGGSGGWKGDVPRYRYDLKKIHAMGWKARYSSREAVEIAVRRMLQS